MQASVPDERWVHVETLFQQAADFPPGRREAFLRERCTDPEIREEVLSLLRYDTGPDGDTEEESWLLLDAVQASAASLIADNPSAGCMLGPYRIEREIGRGGMSVVYSALRADGEFQKRVAIKLIRRGMDTQAVMARLRRERGILAALEHPSIARLLDGGTTAEGAPWIAMEYVEGLPIDRYCDERNLSIADIFRLFDKVCDAVAYAHRNLVVHRDLKPGNILIAPDGSPKLLDFGIAGLLGDDDGDPDGPPMRGAVRPLTPEYASPEQIRGGAVGTSTDVYSLGIVLYELLAGRRPDKPEAGKASEASMQGGKGARWSAQLRGDPDHMLQMALREDPDRRYLTVEQLQADLRRYLTGMPVAACPDTWRYRFGKFVKRHPAGVPAFAVIVLATIVAGVLILRAEREAQAQRVKSEERLGQLVALANTTLFDLHGAIARLPGATQARLEIVQKTLASLDRLNTESGDDVRVRTALASAYGKVAKVQGSPLQPNLGDLRGAEQSYRKAEKILAAVMAEAGTARTADTDLLLQDSELRADYGVLLAETGRRDEAVQQYRAAVTSAEKVVARDAHGLQARNLRENAQLGMGQILKYKDSSATRQTDVGLMPEFEALAREYPQDSNALLNLASLWSQIGSTFDQESRLAEAVDDFRKSAALREQLFARRPQDVQVQHDLLISYGHLGDLTGSPLVMNLGDYNGAVNWYRKAAAIADRMAAADPSDAQARNDSGTASMRIGASLTAAGNYRAALVSLARAESILEPLRASSPESVSLAQRVGILYEHKGRALSGLGEPALAAEALERGAAVCRASLKNSSDLSVQHTLWIIEGLLASALTSAGNVDEGLRQAQDELENVQRNSGEKLTRYYLPRALASNGAVHAILAKKGLGGGRAAEWRTAGDFYRRAMEAWRTIPSRSVEPFLSDARQTEAGLAEAERALRAPGM